MPNTADADELARRLDRIQTLTDDLAKSRSDAIEVQDLAERIRREILMARQALKPSP